MRKLFFIIPAVVIVGAGLWWFNRPNPPRVTTAVPLVTDAPAPGIPDLREAKWLVLGPFANPARDEAGGECPGFNRDFLAAQGGEAHVKPREGQTMADLTWRAVAAHGGAVDLAFIHPQTEYSVAYAYTEVESAKTQTVALKLGSDDGVKVWLNGRLILEHHIHRGVTADEDAIPLDLKTGFNRLLFKIDQGNGGWGFVARCRDLAAEYVDWARCQSPRLRVWTGTQATAGTDHVLQVATSPSYAVRLPIRLTLQDADGMQIMQRDARTGDRITLSQPAGYTGVAMAQAISFGSEADVKSDPLPLVIGDRPKAVAELAAKARRLAQGYTAAAGSEDIAATLRFYSDQIEGKGNPLLYNAGRNDPALMNLAQICLMLGKGGWQPGSLRGFRPWAYRSEIDDTDQPYTLYLPHSYDPQKKYGLIVALHGYTGDDFAGKMLADLEPEDFLIVSPFGRGDMYYRSIGEQDVLDVLDRVQRIYSVDPDRTYLVGWSMGGLGTWRLGQFFSDRFAAIAPFCGWTGTEYLENLRNTPTLVVHGDADPTVPIQPDRDAVASLRKLGGTVRYNELPGADHDAWGAWVRGTDGNKLLAFFRQYKRDPWPKRVDLKVPFERYGKQYWVKIDELTKPGTPGLVSASIHGERAIVVKTNQVKVFTLDLRHPGLARTGVITITIDGAAISIPASAQSVVFSRENRQKWSIDRAADPNTVRHDGAGLGDLYTGPVTIVYGTTDGSRVDTLRRAAQTFFAWRWSESTQLGVKIGDFPVKADSEVTEEDMRTRNLILIGDPAENKLTGKIANQIPIRITNAAVSVAGKTFAGAGALLIYPNPMSRKHLVGVLTLPYDQSLLDSFAIVATFPPRIMTQGMFLNGDMSIRGYSTPDILVFDLRKPYGVDWNFNGNLSPRDLEFFGFDRRQVLWAGWFDRDWKLID